jgi:hypothetical protein
LPPRQVYYDYDDDPEFWIFVNFNNLLSRNLRTVILPPRERVVIIQQTVVVNRTIYVDSGSRVAFNPGIEPSIVAASVGEPIRVTEVQPRVISGTTGVRNAVEISADDSAQLQQAARAEIKESTKRSSRRRMCRSRRRSVEASRDASANASRAQRRRPRSGRAS